MRKTIALAVSILAIATYASSQKLTLDPTFGNKGIASIFSGSKGNFGSEVAFKILPLDNGKSLLFINEDNSIRVSRRMPDGKADKTYGTDGYSDPIRSYAFDAPGVVQPDGKVVVAGNTDYYSSDILVARLTADGKLDATFGNGGVQVVDLGSVHDNVIDVAITSDNKLIVCANTETNGVSYTALIRFTSNGLVDNSFNGTGKAIFTQQSYSRAITIQPDNKIVMLAFDSNYYMTLIRYTTDGVPDPLFGTDGLLSTSEGMVSAAIAMHGSDKIICGGTSFGGVFGGSFKLLQFNLDGSPDYSFGQGGSTTTEFQQGVNTMMDLSVAADGSIAASGYTSIDPSTSPVYVRPDFAVARYLPDGSPDNNFNGNGKVIVDFKQLDDVANSVIVQNGKVLAAGYSYVGNGYDIAMARFNADGSRDAQFGIGGLLQDFISLYTAGPVDMQKDGDGRLLVSGNYLQLTGNGGEVTGKNFLARYKKDGSADKSFGNKGVADAGKTYLFTTFNDKILLAEGLNSDFAIRRLKSDGTPDLSFGTGGISAIDFGYTEIPSILRQQSRKKAIICGFSYGGTTGADLALCRIGQDGKPDRNFGVRGKLLIDIAEGSDDYGTNMEIADDGKIIISGNYYKNGISSLFILRLTADGTPDVSFGNKGVFTFNLKNNDLPLAMLLQPNGAVVASGQGYIDFFSTPTTYIIRVTKAGVKDNTFGAGGIVYAEASSLALQTNGKIIAGSQQNDLYRGTMKLTRWFTNGTPDNSFGTNGKLITRVGIGSEFIIKLIPDADELYALGSPLTAPIPSYILNYKSGSNAREMNDEPEIILPVLSINVLPNPSATSFHLVATGYTGSDPIRLRVTDISGRLVESKQFTPGTAIEFGKDYKAGIYIADMSYGEKREVVRLVKL
jgi:uncharacterized delta-60 repeat protein